MSSLDDRGAESEPRSREKKCNKNFNCDGIDFNKKNFEFGTNNSSISTVNKNFGLEPKSTQEIQYNVKSPLREKRDNCFIDHKIEL